MSWFRNPSWFDGLLLLFRGCRADKTGPTIDCNRFSSDSRVANYDITMVESNWCEECQEACHDHPTMCSVCGTPLTEEPTNVSSANQQRLLQNSQEFRDLLGTLRGNIQELDSAAQNILQSSLDLMGTVRGDLEELNRTLRNSENNMTNLPAEAWDPQQATARSRPTSKKALDQMTRILLHEHSTLFRQATLKVRLESKHRAIDCTLGEFGSAAEYTFENDTCLVLASPRTGKGGLDESTKARVSQLLAHGKTVVLVLKRGDGLTFVQKANMAQDVGAAAVIIGNNTATPWPYVMKDSKGESKKPGQSVTIPVAMIKEEESKKLVQQFESLPQSCLDCELTIRSQSTNCPVCCEDMNKGETVLQLPGCGHVFHQDCALAWLTKHNTCPYCRLELPTDDPQYEAERRRRQNQQQTERAGNGSGNGESFYG